MTEERPSVKHPLALYWAIGSIDAARGKKYEECPFKEDLASGRIWQRGYQAYIEERKDLKRI
jgi:hypothetical protein